MPVQRTDEAESALNELRDALREAGVTLPSLWLDLTAYAGPGKVQLIELGRCNIDTARALAAALRAGRTAEAAR
ncbi:hypothetical protein [Streptomyces sp. MAR4 CNX-425]|uniref:hypothetical protein n=1 Tax=Streptomyces sp. MAR4 CNX-425 TaxID=3406343 RepID=UPI003B50A844